jgi:hypothetical protein
MRAALTGQAKVVAVSFASRIDLTFSSDASMEKAYRQEVSGEMFPDFGLHPALGRLLSEEDDRIPGAKPLAVLSYDYWTARFGRDPAVIGRTFHMGNVVYQIVGVAPKGFIGTEPGTMTDIFAPTMEAASVNRDNSLLLAAIGLYGVLNYSVLQREREIGIRLAVGARTGNIAWLVTIRVMAMVMVGALAGLVIALGSDRYVSALLYRVKANDPGMLMFPMSVLLTATLLAVLPAVRRAVMIDPSVMLRAE